VAVSMITDQCKSSISFR